MWGKIERVGFWPQTTQASVVCSPLKMGPSIGASLPFGTPCIGWYYTTILPFWDVFFDPFQYCWFCIQIIYWNVKETLQEAKQYWTILYKKYKLVIIGRFCYTSSPTYTDRSCADIISHCVVLLPTSCYPSFLYVATCGSQSIRTV